MCSGPQGKASFYCIAFPAGKCHSAGKSSQLHSLCTEVQTAICIASFRYGSGTPKLKPDYFGGWMGKVERVLCKKTLGLLGINAWN